MSEKSDDGSGTGSTSPKAAHETGAQSETAPDAPPPATKPPATKPPTVKKSGRRRASTVPVPGSDPTPQATPDGTPVRASEDTDQAWGDRPPVGGTPAAGPNDERLKRDKPPHW